MLLKNGGATLPVTKAVEDHRSHRLCGNGDGRSFLVRAGRPDANPRPRHCVTRSSSVCCRGQKLIYAGLCGPLRQGIRGQARRHQGCAGGRSRHLHRRGGLRSFGRRRVAHQSRALRRAAGTVGGPGRRRPAHRPRGRDRAAAHSRLCQRERQRHSDRLARRHGGPHGARRSADGRGLSLRQAADDVPALGRPDPHILQRSADEPPGQGKPLHDRLRGRGGRRRCFRSGSAFRTRRSPIPISRSASRRCLATARSKSPCA